MPPEWRTDLTLQQIADGEIDDKIVLNSIFDPRIETIAAEEGLHTYVVNEHQFMNIRELSDGSRWYSSMPQGDNKIRVEEGQTYRVRIFVHNNNPLGAAMTAEDLTAAVNVGTAEASQEKIITAFLRASNAEENYGGGEYGIFDEIALVSSDGRRFNVAFVPGSARFINAWTNSLSDLPEGIPLSDSLFSYSGVRLGFDQYNPETMEFDGSLPGGYPYSGWLFFDIIPQFER